LHGRLNAANSALVGFALSTVPVLLWWVVYGTLDYEAVIQTNPQSTREIYAVAAQIAGWAIVALLLLVPAAGGVLIATRCVWWLPFCIGAALPLVPPLMFVTSFAAGMVHF
jgi:hypothetical protein